MQRLESVAAVGRAIGQRQQADVQFGGRVRTERRLHVGKLTSGRELAGLPPSD